MEFEQPKPENIQGKKSEKLSLAARAIAALGFIAGGTAGAISQNSIEASGENSWGAKTEMINPNTSAETLSSPTPPVEAKPTPSPVPTMGEPWSATPTPNPETPSSTIVVPSPTPSSSSYLFTPRSPESPAQLPQTGGAVSENQNGGIKDKLMLALGAALSGLGIGIANKQRSSQK